MHSIWRIFYACIIIFFSKGPIQTVKLALDKPSVGQGQLVIAPLGHAVVVGDHDKSLTFPVPQFFEKFEQRIGISGVQVAGGLIGQDYIRFVHECSGSGHALLLTSAELIGAVVHAVAQSQISQEPFPTVFFSASIGTKNPSGHEHILQGAKLWEQAMELKNESYSLIAKSRECLALELLHLLASDLKCPGVRCVQGPQDLQQRCFSSTGSAGNGCDFVASKVQIDATKHIDIPKGFGNSARLNDEFLHACKLRWNRVSCSLPLPRIYKRFMR